MSNIYIMNRIQETYLELLKAAIWDSKELTSEGVRELGSEGVNELLRLAAFQGTGPLVFDQLLKLKDVEIPDALRMQMKQQCMMSMMQQNTMMPILRKAWTALVQADIHPVLLKGFALAQYYPQPYLRQWGDIDIYVGQKNYHKGCEVLRGVFPEATHPEEENEDFKHFNFEFGNTMLEMHRISMEFAHPKDRRYYELLEEQCLTKDGPSFEADGLSITTPEDTFNVFFVLLHAWHHFEGTGMNIKQLCDVAVLLHAKRDVIDRVRLKEMLTKLHMMEVWQLIMYIMAHYFEVPQEECPFFTEGCRQRVEMLFERILVEGSSRARTHVDIKGVSYMKRKWLTWKMRLDGARIVRPCAPSIARHMVWSAVVHGIERTIRQK